MSENLSKPMPKELCCSNLLTCESYIKSVLPEIPHDRLFEGIIENNEFLTTSEQTGNVVPVTPDFLLNANNWVSTKLETRVYQNTVAILNDPDAVYKAGRHIFKTALIGRLALILRIMPVKTIISRTPKEDAKFNRVKDVEIVQNSNGYGVVRLHWHKNTEVTKLTCDMNRGVYEGLGTLTRNPVSVKEEVCHFEGGDFCEYHIRWKAKPFFARMVDLYRFWISREIIEELESKIGEINDFRVNQDRVIKLRTKALKEAQNQLVEAEKRTLEHRITGGFAHEMRNALAGAQLEFKTTLNYKDQGKPSAEILKDSATTLLKSISLIHEKYNIARKEIVTLLLPELKTIAEIADHLAGVHTDVSSDLDRGFPSQLRSETTLRCRS